MILVFSPTYVVAKMWAQDNQVPQSQWRLVKCANDVRGYGNAEFVILGVPEGQLSQGQLEALSYMRSVHGLNAHRDCTADDPIDYNDQSPE